ncbi:MAG: hypothetical protein HUK21_05645 [Fibrobacteraceae bacterium]|nr:hypothetical protein [Fibrobacteraceae bacterium]
MKKKNWIGIFSVTASLGLLACAGNNPPAELTEIRGSQNGGAISVAPQAPSTTFLLKLEGEQKQTRVIEKPTLAALDFAAYNNNPIRLAGKEEAPENYGGLMAKAQMSAYPFDMLESLSAVQPSFLNGIQAVAWEPFAKILYAASHLDSLNVLLTGVEGVKWNEPNVFRQFQRVNRLWGVTYEGKDSVEWWVEVLPAPWTNRSVFYGKLRYRSDAKAKEILWDYLSRELNGEEVMDWIRSLSSYWYPTLNTDLEQHLSGTKWESSKPFAVMRGNPMGTPMWVAFETPSLVLSDAKIEELKKVSASVDGPISRTLDTTSDFRLATLAAVENSCPAGEATEKFRDALSKKLASLPKEQNAWSEGGMLWFRRNANYLVSGQISAQDSLHNPLPRLVELKKYLDSLQIQLLVVPVPVKEEIYAHKLVPQTPADLCVNPNGRAFTAELLKAGIDVLDLYPALMAARGGDDNEGAHYSFQRYDTHWALPGMLAAMEQLASRVTQYSWYGESGALPGSLEMRDSVTLREGDLVAHLPDGEKSMYTADTLNVMKVYKEGSPYKGGKNAPILLMGDSFTGVFESVDQKSGGPGSLLAFATGLDVQVLTSWGGGPGVRSRLPKMDLGSKRLVIYMMTARDFWQSPMEWDGM